MRLPRFARNDNAPQRPKRVIYILYICNMLIERQDNDLVIKIPASIVNLKEIQSFLDFLRFKEITDKSKATKKDLTDLLTVVKKNRKIK
jgi:hypothetical protein